MNIIAKNLMGGGKSLSYLVIALAALAAVQSAWGADYAQYHWTGKGDGYWETDVNWESDTTTIEKYRGHHFDKAAETKIVKFSTVNEADGRIAIEGVDNGSSDEDPYVFLADDNDSGVKLKGVSSDFEIGNWKQGHLHVLRGTYKCAAVKAGNSENNGNVPLVIGGGGAGINATLSATYTGDAVIVQKGMVKVLANGTLNCSGIFKVGPTSGLTGEVLVDGGMVSSEQDFCIYRGALTINSGSLEVAPGKWMAFYKSKDANTVTLNGGTLTISQFGRNDDGTGTIVFNGGTLVANQNSTEAGRGLIYSAITVKVMERGGTINTGGFTVDINAALSEDPSSTGGGMTFKGGGIVKLASGNTYKGNTTVELGTTVHVVSASDIGGGIAVTLPATPVEDAYTLIVIDGDGAFDASILNGVDVPTDATLRLSADRKSILCIYGNPVNTWVGGLSGSLSDASNWSFGSVPKSGESCVIGSETAASLTNPEGSIFAPASITFPANSKVVTIYGDAAITGIEAITNLSESAHIFNCAVEGEVIDFYNDFNRCEFRGGITLTTPSFGGGESNKARGLVGNWCFTGDWTPTIYNCVGVNSEPKSSVTVKGELLNPKNLSIESGSVVTAATMKATGDNSYSAYDNNGRLVIIGKVEIATTQDFRWLREDSQNGVIIVGGIVFKTDKWPWLNAKTLVVGKDGINFDSEHNNTLRFSNSHDLKLYARDETLTLGAGYEEKTQMYAINTGTTLTICTTQFESEDAATVYVNGKISYENGDQRWYGGMAVTGKGTLVFNSLSTFSGGLVVGDTAIVKVSANCTPGTGAITLGPGTTLALTATSREFTPLANDLKLPMEGVATIRIDGVRLRSGENQVASVASGSGTADNVVFDATSDAFNGRKYSWYIDDSGYLVLNIQSSGTVIIVR